MGWECKSCGPLRDRPLHGADEKHHCPNLDCDDIVTWKSEADAPISYGWKARQARDRAALTAKLSGGGQDMGLRTGKCGRCGKRKTLQKSTGPASEHRCHKCNGLDKREGPAPAAAAADEPTPLDVIGQEIRAMEQCARALDGLPEASLRRVLTYLGDRLGPLALKAHQEPAALPGPSAEESSEDEVPVRLHSRPRFESDDEDTDE